MQIGDRILGLITINGMTQKQLANELNVAVSTLNGYVKNARTPDYNTIISISRYFNVSAGYLLGEPELEKFINEPEAKLLEHFRVLTAEKQNFLIRQAETLYSMDFM